MRQLDQRIRTVILQNEIKQTYGQLDPRTVDRELLVDRLKTSLSTWLNQDLQGIDYACRDQLHFLAFLIGLKPSLDVHNPSYAQVLQLIEEYRPVMLDINFEWEVVLELRFDAGDTLSRIIVLILAYCIAKGAEYKELRSCRREEGDSIGAIGDMRMVIELLVELNTLKLSNRAMLAIGQMLSGRRNFSRVIAAITGQYNDCAFEMAADEATVTSAFERSQGNKDACELLLLVYNAYKRRSKDRLSVLHLESYLKLTSRDHLCCHGYSIPSSAHSLALVSTKTEEHYIELYRTHIERAGYYLERRLFSAKIYNPLVIVGWLSLNPKILSVSLLRLIRQWYFEWEYTVTSTLSQGTANSTMKEHKRQAAAQKAIHAYKLKLVG